MITKKVCVSYSLGKDSTLALHRSIQAGNEVVALIISINEENDRSWFHGVNQEIIQKTSESLNIPIIYAKSKGEDYQEVFIKTLVKAKKLGVTECVFGDIDIIEHQEWCSNVCNEAGLKANFPLWKENRKTLVEEFIDCGFKALIKTVSKQHSLPKSLLFRTLTKEVLKELEAFQVDVCGENGEYHTLVYDGPLFKNTIKVKNEGIHESEYSYSVILKLEENNISE
ncbi:hypothetical protein UJ101_00006 [Flavobacteriaceae bacterium UJ101]|nr:hypothetical protein UJ101_00006 [Flavobacteriaceae bacterium UJ101]